MNRFDRFVQEMTRLVERYRDDEASILNAGDWLLRDLVSRDDWLPERFARHSCDSYRQYLMHCDPQERFSVVSFVWLPGQKTPIHDHTVWGLVGVLRGVEKCDEYSTGICLVGSHLVRSGDVDGVSPSIGDIHVVSNVSNETAVSIHVYGANIGRVRRHMFDPVSRLPREFVSGYHDLSA